MKMVSFSVEGKKSIGILLEKSVVDLVSCCKEFRGQLGEGADTVKTPCMIDFLRLGEKGVAMAKRIEGLCIRNFDDLATPNGFVYDLDAVRLLAPFCNFGKIICLGLNYSDHAKEAGKPEPKEPILFSKPSTAVVGPDEPIVYPRISKKVDYEVELAVVIGKGGKDIPKQEAFDHIAGYTVLDDVSARDIQFGDGQWFRGKSFDTFAPMGPCLVLREQMPNPNKLRLGTRVNGEVRQDGTTANMIFNVPYIVAFVSQVMTLETGDVIATGTPAGVGVFWKPEPRLLKPGDVIETWIEGIGVLRNPVRRSD